MEQIVAGSIIAVGRHESIRAVVSSIRSGRVEVVYLDAAGRALHREAEWRKGAWEFAEDAHEGRSAEKDARLERYVKLLRVQHT